MLTKLIVFANVVLLAVFGFALYEAQHNNQIVSPFATKPFPVVQQLPSYVALLRSTKDVCESELTAAFQQPRSDDGRAAYEGVRTSSSNVIDYLRSGLARRFNDDDLQEIQKRLTDLETAVKKFDSWCATSGPPTASGPQTTAYYQVFKSVEQSVPDWLECVRNQNELAIDRLRADLEASRMRAWWGTSYSATQQEAPTIGLYQPRVERQARYPKPSDNDGWRPARPR